MIPLRIPVLTYHAIEQAETPIAVSPARFTATMQAMHRGGWRTAPDSRVRQALATGEWPERTFVLHFDDGFASVATHAVPVLARCEFRATVFVVSDWAGRDNGWPSQPARVPRWPLLDWAALRRLRDAGFAIGAHSCSHPSLPALARADLVREIGDGAARIEQELGLRPDVFAYPYGATNAAVREAVSACYGLAYGTNFDFVTAGARPLDLDRLDGWYLSPERAASLDRPATRAWVAGRRWLRQARRAVLPSRA